MAPRGKGKAKKGARRPAGRRRPFRKARDVPDMASLSVTSTLTPPPGNPNFLSGFMYSLMNTELANFPRAVQVSKAYQHYRISKITLKLKPSVDTFGQGGPSKTYLYYMIDKSGSVPTNPTLELLKQMGAKPHAFDEKVKVISWRPSVLADTATNAGALASTPNKYMVSPWLSTNANVVSPAAFNPSVVDHLGVYWFVDQAFQSGYGYVAEVEVQFQFKKPVWVSVSGAVAAIPALPATPDNSRDGIAETLGDEPPLT